jgi:hypothetical protein
MDWLFCKTANGLYFGGSIPRLGSGLRQWPSAHSRQNRAQMGPAWNLLGCTINYTRGELWKIGKIARIAKSKNLKGASLPPAPYLVYLRRGQDFFFARFSGGCWFFLRRRLSSARRSSARRKTSSGSRIESSMAKRLRCKESSKYEGRRHPLLHDALSS